MKAEKIYLAKTKGLPFLDEETASWLAIEALVISIGNGSQFTPLFAGILAQRYLEWLKDHHKDLSEAERSKTLTRVLKLDEWRLRARDLMTDVDQVFSEGVSPLGRAISLIWHDGMSKADALAEQAAYGKSLRRHVDPKQEERFPKAMKDVSIRTLERRWAQYQTVLPHVLLIYLRQRALIFEKPAPHAADLEAIGTELRHKLFAGAKTRRPDLAPWTELRFF
ncbi:hypothetical protein [Jannaschia sp. 2305UL9-9]|uniref:hypothetical protein n=1 Tax=Jannaschia sp. 2305UL9-9 TaxID=3121638 RepID=UPI003527AA78